MIKSAGIPGLAAPATVQFAAPGRSDETTMGAIGFIASTTR
jgi:hypothetical protein